MLTDIDLQNILDQCDDSHPEDVAHIVGPVNAELHRRQHGPFTLAEAIASGRPFRRRHWAEGAYTTGITSRGIPPDQDGYFDAFYTAFEFIDGNKTNDERVTEDDITATDYELQE